MMSRDMSSSGLMSLAESTGTSASFYPLSPSVSTNSFLSLISAKPKVPLKCIVDNADPSGTQGASTISCTDVVELPWGEGVEIAGVQEVKEAIGLLIGVETVQFELLWKSRLASDKDNWGNWLETPEFLKIGMRAQGNSITLQIEHEDSTYLVEIGTADTVLQLKEGLKTCTKIEIEDQIIMRKQRILDNCYKTIGELRLMTGHKLRLQRKPTKSFLYLKTTEWWTQLIETDLSATVDSLKEKIHTELGNCHPSKLILLGKMRKILNNERTLASYQTNSEDCLQLKYLNIGNERTITASLPDGNPIIRQLDERTSLHCLTTDLFSYSGTQTDQFLLTTTENWVLTTLSRPVSQVSDQLWVLNVSGSTTYVLVERREVGLAHFVDNVTDVNEVRERLSGEFGYDLAEQVLIYKGKFLTDEVITDLNMQKSDCIQLLLHSDLVTLYVYKSKTAWISLEIAYGSSIANLKSRITELERVPTSSQILIYDGKELSDSSILPECGLLPNSTLLLLTSLPAQYGTDLSIMQEITQEIAKDTLIASIRKLQTANQSQYDTNGIWLDRASSAQFVPMIKGKGIEILKIDSEEGKLETNLRFFAVALNRKFAPIPFFPRIMNDFGFFLELKDCQTLILALLMKGRVSSGREETAVTVFLLAGEPYPPEMQLPGPILSVKEIPTDMAGKSYEPDLFHHTLILDLLTKEAREKLSQLSPFQYNLEPASGHTKGPTLLPNNSIYIGQWLHGFRSGKGRVYTAEGGLREGYWNGMLLNGRDIQPTGCLYEGGYSEGKKQGCGRQEDLSQENVYEGDWLNDKFHGKGTECVKNQFSYEGQFADGLKSGFGVTKWDTGEVYEGEFLKNAMNGRGKYVWKSDVKWYEGEWKKGKMHGKGRFVNEGKEYEGDFKADKKHGRGVYRWEGNVYEGDFVDGKMHGRGYLTMRGKERKLYAFQNNKRLSLITEP